MDLITSFLIGVMGVAVGGIVTFIAQRKIQERAWKKERAEKIYAPLLDQLNGVEANLYKLTTSPSYPEWRGIRERHLSHWIKPELRKKLWIFFEVELHNFNVGLIAIINDIKEPMKEEILQKIKEERRDEVQRTTPSSSEFFWNELAKLAVKREETGGFFGGIDTYPSIRSGYSQLEKDFETEMPLDNFIKNFASKIKDKPLLKEVKEELKGLISKTQDLRQEVEKEMGLK